jgi:hypothetical protein
MASAFFGTAPGASSRQSNTRGGLYVLPYPVLLTGPTATPAVTSCLVQWTTDVAAYHRVRYHKGADAWTYSAWSLTATTNAAVTITPLTPEHELYYYQIQSCLVGDGSQAFDWAPGSIPTFYTTCANVITYSAFEMILDEEGTAYWHWHTNIATVGKARHRIYLSTWNAWSAYSVPYLTEITRSSLPPFIPDPIRVYQVQIQSKNKCGYEGEIRTYLITFSGGVWVIV